MSAASSPHSSVAATNDNNNNAVGTKIQALLAMGYSEGKCTTALKVAGGDMEQAVGFLLMGDKSQRGFDFSFEESITSSGVAGPGDGGDLGSSGAGRAGSPVLPLTTTTYTDPFPGRSIGFLPVSPEPMINSAPNFSATTSRYIG